MREVYVRAGLVPSVVIWPEVTRIRRDRDWPRHVISVREYSGPRPHLLDSENRRWLLDGSGDVA